MLSPDGHDPYFEPEWCERCGQEGHNGLHCQEQYEPSPYDGTYSED